MMSKFLYEPMNDKTIDRIKDGIKDRIKDRMAYAVQNYY